MYAFSWLDDLGHEEECLLRQMPLSESSAQYGSVLVELYVRENSFAWSIDCSPPSPHLLKFVAVYACVKRVLDTCHIYNNFPGKVCGNVADGTKIVTYIPFSYPATSLHTVKKVAATSMAAFHCSVMITSWKCLKTFEKAE